MDHEEIMKKKWETFQAVKNFNQLLVTIGIIIVIVLFFLMFFMVSNKLGEFERRQMEMSRQIDLIQEKLQAYGE